MGSSTDTRNFGMRRFTNLVRDGRLRSPLATSIRLGAMVEEDPGNLGYVREATASGAAGAGGVQTSRCGVLWYEHDAATTEGVAAGTLVQDYNFPPPGRLVQVLRGKGAKIWLRNTLVGPANKTPGLNFPNTRAAVTMVASIATVAVGDLLGWDPALHQWKEVTDVTDAFLLVTEKYTDGLTIDAEFLV